MFSQFGSLLLYLVPFASCALAAFCICRYLTKSRQACSSSPPVQQSDHSSESLPRRDQQRAATGKVELS